MRRRNPSRSRSATTCSPRCAPPRDPWPGVLGFVHRAAAARAGAARRDDVVLLGGARPGQDPSARALVGLLDGGSPSSPAPSWASTRSRRSRRPRSAAPSSSVDDLPVAWRHRDKRYTEKLATPDTAVARPDRRRRPGQGGRGPLAGRSRTIHYAWSRARVGIVAINELPVLAERIQVALLNVMEERDVQVHGYALRLPLDVVLVASANPRTTPTTGRIITRSRTGSVRRCAPTPAGAGRARGDRQETGASAAVRRSCSRSSPVRSVAARSPSAIDQRPRRVGPCSPSQRPGHGRGPRCGGPRSRGRAPTARPINLVGSGHLRGRLEFAFGEAPRRDADPPAAARHCGRGPRPAARLDLTPLAEAVAQSPVAPGSRLPRRRSSRPCPARPC